MRELSITDVLRRLEADDRPSPQYEQRLRERLELELTGDGAATTSTSWIPTTSATTADEEVVVMELAESPTRAPVRGSRRMMWPAVAAVALVVAALAAVIGTRDDGPVVPTGETELSYVAAERTVTNGIPSAFRIAAAGDTVWVASANGQLSRLDPETGEVQATAAGPPFAAIAVTGDDLWVSDRSSGAILRFDPATGAQRESVQLDLRLLERGSAGYGTVVVEPDDDAPRPTTLTEIAASSGVVWAGDNDGRLHRLDIATGQVRLVEVPFAPKRLTLNGGRLVVTDDQSRIAILDATSGEIAAQQDGFAELGAATSHAGSVYVHDRGSGTVIRLTPGGGRAESAPLGSSTSGAGLPAEIELAVNDHAVLVAIGSTLHVLHPSSLEPLGTVELPGRGGSITLNDDIAWAARYTAGSVVRIEPADR